MSAILALLHHSLDDRVKHLAIMLNCSDDTNVCLVIRRALQKVDLPIIAGLYERAAMDVMTGLRASRDFPPVKNIVFSGKAMRKDHPEVPKTVVGAFLNLLRTSTLTTEAQVKGMGLRAPAWKRKRDSTPPISPPGANSKW